MVTLSLNGKCNIPVLTFFLTAILTLGAVNAQAAPYTGSPLPIPGRIQAEYFDTGASGTAYSDSTAGNEHNLHWGGTTTFRTNTNVDIKNLTIDDYTVGYMVAGEWLSYTVNVTATGSYTMRAHLASVVATGALDVYFDGVNLTASNPFQVNTGCWFYDTNYPSCGTIQERTVSLTAGQHTMRIYVRNSDIDIDWIEFVQAVSCGNVILSSGPHTFNGNVSSAVIKPHDPKYLLSEGTIEVKFRTTNTTAERGVFSKDSLGFDTGGHILNYIGLGGAYHFRLQSATADNYITMASGFISPNVDYHIVSSFGPAGMKLYKNGVKVGSNTYTGGLNVNKQDWVLGANSWQSGDLVNTPLVMPLLGSISTFNLYDKQLPDAAIANLASGVSCTNNLVELLFPTTGSTINTSSVNFQWTSNASVSEAWIAVGKKSGGSEILYWTQVWPNLSKTVSNIPLDGSTVYFEMWYKINGTFYSLKQSFPTIDNTPKPVVITSPTAGSTLNSNSVSFQWTAASNITQVWIALGKTSGGSDIFHWANVYPNTSQTITNIPLKGNPVYFDLWYRTTSNQWFEVKQMYQTSNAGLVTIEMTPSDGSLLASGTQMFQWTHHPNVIEAWMALGSKPSGADVLKWVRVWPNLTYTVNNIPQDGRLVYLEFWYKTIDGEWLAIKPVYTTSNSGGGLLSLIDPVPGTILSEPTVTFNWTTNASVSEAWIAVGASVKSDGSVKPDILNWQQVWPSLSKSVSGIPFTGKPIFFEFWYKIDTKWYPVRATYQTPQQ